MVIHRQVVRASAVKLTVELPRVVIRDHGRVGHVLITAGWMAAYLASPNHPHGDVACHAADNTSWRQENLEEFEPAKPDTPTCKACLRALRSIVRAEEAT